jgi:hypothetical protein
MIIDEKGYISRDLRRKVHIKPSVFLLKDNQNLGSLRVPEHLVGKRVRFKVEIVSETAV